MIPARARWGRQISNLACVWGRLFVGVLCLGLVAGCTEEQKIGAPAFLKLASGEQISRNALRGRWLFVNYWAEWCAPCREEISELNVLHEEVAGTFVLGVNPDRPDANALRSQIERLGIRFPVVVSDPVIAFGLEVPEVVPSTAVFDPDGVQRALLHGPQALETLSAVMTSEK